MFKTNLYYSDGKKVISFGLFIVPITIFLVFLLPLATKYPALIAILSVSFAITFVLLLLCCLCVGLKTDRYVQKHNFQLWKKSKSHSLKERREAAKAINSMSMQIPYLEKYLKYLNKIAFILFTIWTLIFLAIFSFIIFSAM